MGCLKSQETRIRRDASLLKEVRSRILHIIGSWSLFRLMRIYISLHFQPIR